VILDAGTRQGWWRAVGSSSYRPSREVRDPLTKELLMVPDDVIGDLFGREGERRHVARAGDEVRARPARRRFIPQLTVTSLACGSLRAALASPSRCSSAGSRGLESQSK